MPDKPESPEAAAGLAVQPVLESGSRIMSLNCEPREVRDETSSSGERLSLSSGGRLAGNTSTNGWGLLTIIYLFMLNIRLSESLTSHEVKDSVSTVLATRCWQVEQFMVAEECKKCTRFQVKTQEACGPTGFVEKINCSESQKEEYKSCRSTGMEETLFWRFEGTMVTLSVVFAVMVVLRQRTLDRLASEKVRKQIESI